MNSTNHRSPLVCVFLIAVTVATLAAVPLRSKAGDWPQILGPTRNGIAADEKLVDVFPSTGPPVLWEREVGQGVAGVAVKGERVVLWHRDAEGDRATCCNKLNGDELWQSESFATNYQSAILDDSGPRCVPLIEGKRVFVYAGNGDLHCLNLDDGRTLWSRSLHADYATGAEAGYFGAGSTPILSHGKLWVNVGGGRAEAGIVALDPNSGETVWQGTTEGGSYSSPVVATIGGKERLIFLTRMNVLSLDPATGEVDWKVPFGKRGPTVNGANPLLFDYHVFLTAAYGLGGKCLELKLDEPRTVWERDDVMSSQFTTPIIVDGVAYGIDGRQDLGVARMRAFDPKSGEVFWTKEGFGKATLLLADDKLLALKTSGELVMISPDKSEYKELCSAEIMDSTCLALPALSDGLLFVRDQTKLRCIDLRPRK